jgi:hypothetical protein
LLGTAEALLRLLPPPGDLPAAAGELLPLLPPVGDGLATAAGELLALLPPADEVLATAGALLPLLAPPDGLLANGGAEPLPQALSTSAREVPAPSRMLRILVIDLISSRAAAAPAILGLGPAPSAVGNLRDAPTRPRLGAAAAPALDGDGHDVPVTATRV